MLGGRLDSLELLRNIAGICLISNSCAGLKQLPKLGQEGIFFWFGLAEFCIHRNMKTFSLTKVFPVIMIFSPLTHCKLDLRLGCHGVYGVNIFL